MPHSRGMRCGYGMPGPSREGERNDVQRQQRVYVGGDVSVGELHGRNDSNLRTGQPVPERRDLQSVDRYLLERKRRRWNAVQ